MVYSFLLINVFQAVAQVKNIHLRYTAEIPENTAVQLDAAKLEMVINNLLSNALKFTPEGGDVYVMVETVDGRWSTVDGAPVSPLAPDTSPLKNVKKN